MKIQAISLIAYNIKQLLQDEDKVTAVKLYLNTLRATDKINEFLDKENLYILKNYGKKDKVNT